MIEIATILLLDEDDARAVNEAVAALQRLRDERGCYAIAEGGGNLLGRALAEICRGWLEMRSN